LIRVLQQTFLHFCSTIYNNLNEAGFVQTIYSKERTGEKSFTVLIDPDKVNAQSIEQITSLAMDAKVDYFFVGGSLVISNHLDECIQQIKSLCNIPVILFPGSPLK
jgi:putative glycerol-1-phosphate prenyltransferase